MLSTTVLEDHLGLQQAGEVVVADVHDVEVVRQMMEVVEEEVPWPLEGAARDEVPTWLDCSGCDCEKRTDDACTRLPYGSEEVKVETLRAELANHERTYSRTLMAASQ